MEVQGDDDTKLYERCRPMFYRKVGALFVKNEHIIIIIIIIVAIHRRDLHNAMLAAVYTDTDA